MPWAHGKIACNAPRQQYIIYNENYKHLLDTLDEFDGRSGHTASTAAATLTSIICNSSSFMNQVQNDARADAENASFKADKLCLSFQPLNENTSNVSLPADCSHFLYKFELKGKQTRILEPLNTGSLRQRLREVANDISNNNLNDSKRRLIFALLPLISSEKLCGYLLELAISVVAFFAIKCSDMETLLALFERVLSIEDTVLSIHHITECFDQETLKDFNRHFQPVTNQETPVNLAQALLNSIYSEVYSPMSMQIGMEDSQLLQILRSLSVQHVIETQNCWVVFTQGMEVYFIGNSDLPFLRLSLLSICGPHVSKVEEYIYKLNVQSVIEVQAATGYLGVLYLDSEGTQCCLYGNISCNVFAMFKDVDMMACTPSMIATIQKGKTEIYTIETSSHMLTLQGCGLSLASTHKGIYVLLIDRCVYVESIDTISEEISTIIEGNFKACRLVKFENVRAEIQQQINL